MRLPLVITAVVAAVLIAGVAYIAGTRAGDDETTAPVTTTGSSDWNGLTGETGTTGETSATSTAGTDIGDLTGLNLTVYTAKGYAQPSIRKDLRDIKTLGSTSVTLVPTWYMQTRDANSIMPNAAKSPTDASLVRAINLAHRAGLKVVLKPHVDVIDETFRGEIQPVDRVLWFQSYEAMIGHYAQIAARSGADVFVVGTELKTMSTETDAFRKVIDGVRSTFDGPLTYAANWDEVDQVQFWDDLDLIGVDAYYPLSSPGQKPSVDDLVAAWQTPLTALKATSDKWGKPVVMTEIGYPTQADAAVRPYEVVPGEPEDQEAQATAYEAAFRAFADQDWFQGMSWWSWRGDPGDGGRRGSGYPPRDEKAESILASGQGGSRP